MTNDAHLFKATFPTLTGIGFGLVMPTCLTAAWSWYPHNTGFVGGIVTSGMGFGAFFITLIGGAIINPDDDPCYPSEIRPNIYEHVFDSEVAGRLDTF